MEQAPAQPKIYHITHLRNLAQITASGGLWSDAKRIERGLEKLVARQIVGHHVAQLAALGRSVLDVTHIEVNPAAVAEKTAVARGLFVIPIMQIDRAGVHFAEEMILHPHRPGVAVGMRRLTAHQAAIFGLDPCDPIHPFRASDTVAPWTSEKARRNFLV